MKKEFDSEVSQIRAKYSSLLDDLWHMLSAHLEVDLETSLRTGRTAETDPPPSTVTWDRAGTKFCVWRDSGFIHTVDL